MRVYKTRPPAERFWEKVDSESSPDGCWLWTGARVPFGHGRFHDGRRLVMAHRFAYELLVGPIPDGLEIDHVLSRGCRSPSCVNPAHLEPVTHRENLMRAPTNVATIHAAKTHCPRGHPFDGDNLQRHKNGSRRCRDCERARDRARGPRKRAAAKLKTGLL